MPSSFIGEVVLRLIIEVFFEVICYYLGRVVVFIVSLGRIQCDRLTGGASGRKRKWGGSFYRRGRQIHLTAEATSGVGMVCVFLLMANGILVYYLRE